VVSGPSICSTCGTENASGVEFCRSCGATLSRAVSATGEARKIVTVLFSDVTGSTMLGEDLDPESFRRIMSRYFAEMRSLLERHGGTVEKFIGDAVMAVFGVPRAHEDDALRAVRAAAGIQETLAGLNREFKESYGIALSTRTGVNTGEVSTAEATAGQMLVAGDTVNVAARLEQAAEPGEVLIGGSTFQLVRDAVVAEPVEPLTVKGKSRDVAAWRLLEVHAEWAESSRRLGSPLVGRDPELGRLREAFEQTLRESTCRVVTLLGPAGIGKTRLTNEFIAGVGGVATVVQGRCLPYGDGITFWPVVDVLRALSGIEEHDGPDEARSKLEALLAPMGDPTLTDRVEGLIGLAEVTPGIQQTFWAVRRVLEQLAAGRPHVVVFEDIQWGESTFLDLLEYLADRVRSAPVTLLCIARPELLEIRPDWMTGKPHTSLRLEPLNAAAAEGLIGNLVGEGELPEEAIERISQLAEGNPLFIEETLRMLIDDDVLRPVDGHWSVQGDLSRLSIPPTIHALLNARLDRLDPEERAVIERASVVGRTFWWNAVSELTPSEVRPRVARHLQSLTRKELIRPDRTAPEEEDMFSFAHILVRDGAYRRIPKATRAELHGQLADWIEAETREQAGEYEEIVGYHLEQAYRSQLEIGRATDQIQAQGARASAMLRAAGTRAYAREDAPAAVTLLSRAASLLPVGDPGRLEILPELAYALMDTGDFERLQQVVGETAEAAAATDDARLRAHAVILELTIGLFTSPEGSAEEAEREARRAIATFEEHGDARGQAKGWSLLGLVNVTRGRFAAAEEAWEQAASHAALAGARREELEALSWMLLSVWAGPVPADQGRERCRAVFERATGDHKGMASALFMRAVLEAALDNPSEARDLIEESRTLLQEVDLRVWMAGPFAQMAGLVELTSGDPAAAERELRAGYQTLEEIGEMAWLPTLVALLAEAMYAQGRLQEAEEFAGLSEKSAGSEDASSQVLWRGVRGRVLAKRGAEMAALDLVREAREIAETTDSPEVRARALIAYAEVCATLDRRSEAEPLVEQAAALFEAKGNVVSAERARSLLS
jgi:class 3 adenylate cyclase/tetratricopeptide (TPR) repeat protein